MSAGQTRGPRAPVRFRARVRQAAALATVASLAVFVGLRVAGYQRDCRLIAALRRNDTQGALTWLRDGADPNARSYTEYWSPNDFLRDRLGGRPYERYGISALMLAALSGQPIVARELIARGASVEEKTTQGTTALHFAVQYRHPEIAKLLVDAGADSAEPLALARERNYDELLPVLTPARHGR